MDLFNSDSKNKALKELEMAQKEYESSGRRANRAVQVLYKKRKEAVIAIESAEKKMAAGEISEDPLGKMIIPADITLEKLGKILLNDNRITAFINGNSSRSNGFRIMEHSLFDGLYRVYAKAAGSCHDSVFLGVAAIENGSLVPRKVIR